LKEAIVASMVEAREAVVVVVEPEEEDAEEEEELEEEELAVVKGENVRNSMLT
jgi:hypothetical protein